MSHPIRFRCPGCDASIKAPRQLLGRSRDCPGCGRNFVVRFENAAGLRPLPRPRRLGRRARRRRAVSRKRRCRPPERRNFHVARHHRRRLPTPRRRDTSRRREKKVDASQTATYNPLPGRATVPSPCSGPRPLLPPNPPLPPGARPGGSHLPRPEGSTPAPQRARHLSSSRPRTIRRSERTPMTTMIRSYILAVTSSVALLGVTLARPSWLDVLW